MPVVPYVALTLFLVIGPKLEPVRVIAVAPAVVIDNPPATPEIVGSVYDVVPFDEVLACAPTLTRHTKFTPTPGALLH